MQKFGAQVLTLALFFFGLTSLAQTAKKDLWKDSGLHLAMFEQKMFTEHNCRESANHYVGCRVMTELLMAGGEISRDAVVQLCDRARQEFSANPLHENLNLKHFWAHFKKTYIDNPRSPWSAEAALAEAYNIFLAYAYDPHTAIYAEPPAQDIEEAKKSIGIGVYLRKTSQGVMIAKVVSPSPAERAQLAIGDILLKVNNLRVTADVFRETSRELQNGEPGTEVRLTIQRGTKTLQLNLPRATIEETSVMSRLVPYKGQKIGVVEISSFEDIDSVHKSRAFIIQNDEKVASWILDLRNNPGGSMDYAKLVTGSLLPKPQNASPDSSALNRIYIVRFITPPEVLIPRTVDAYQISKKPLVVLINPATGSAAEMAAAALRDYDRALIVGERSFGKATQQITSSLNGSAPLMKDVAPSDFAKLRETTAFFRTNVMFHSPIQEVTHQLRGITPDFTVTMTDSGTPDMSVMREENLYTNPLLPKGPDFKNSAAREETLQRLREKMQGFELNYTGDRQLDYALELLTKMK